jgi:hypothetical protein
MELWLVRSLLSSATVLTIFNEDEIGYYILLDLSRVMEREVDALAISFDFLTISLSSLSKEEVIWVLNRGDTF